MIWGHFFHDLICEQSLFKIQVLNNSCKQYSMTNKHLNFKNKKHTLGLVWIVIFYIVVFIDTWYLLLFLRPTSAAVIKTLLQSKKINFLGLLKLVFTAFAFWDYYSKKRRINDVAFIWGQCLLILIFCSQMRHIFKRGFHLRAASKEVKTIFAILIKLLIGFVILVLNSPSQVFHVCKIE